MWVAYLIAESFKQKFVSLRLGQRRNDIGRHVVHPTLRLHSESYDILHNYSSAKTRRGAIVGLMLGLPRRRWTNIKTIDIEKMVPRLVFAAVWARLK